MKYRTKPIDVEAMRYTGDNFYDIYTFTGGKVMDNEHDNDIELIEWDVVSVVRAGDWIVKFEEDEYGIYDNDSFVDKFEETQ